MRLEMQSQSCVLTSMLPRYNCIVRKNLPVFLTGITHTIEEAILAEKCNRPVYEVRGAIVPHKFLAIASLKQN